MVRILGGGPAGASAAVAALQQGAEVELYEKSRFPRHKVCGEFLSPEALPILERLGVYQECAGAGPALIRRFLLRVGTREKSGTLPEPAWGLSRYRLDSMLLDRAAALGARIVREPRSAADVIARGRTANHARPGRRLFGFKAHFRGASNDAIELYFFRHGYVGVNAVEGGAVNVCGLAREVLLREHGFAPDRLLASCPALAERVRPMTRAMDWLMTGPVVFEDTFSRKETGPYLAGDALGFLDPFTGSGILNALISGSRAGAAAARAAPVETYFSEIRSVLGRPFAFAAAFRAALESGWASMLAPLVPSAWLFRLTRPAAARRSTP
jgi:flavin-dependent dehydrogenase